MSETNTSEITDGPKGDHRSDAGWPGLYTQSPSFRTTTVIAKQMAICCHWPLSQGVILYLSLSEKTLQVLCPEFVCPYIHCFLFRGQSLASTGPWCYDGSGCWTRFCWGLQRRKTSEGEGAAIAAASEVVPMLFITMGKHCFVMAPLPMCFPCKHKDPSSDSQPQHKNRCSSTHLVLGD